MQSFKQPHEKKWAILHKVLSKKQKTLSSGILQFSFIRWLQLLKLDQVKVLIKLLEAGFLNSVFFDTYIVCM